MQTMCTPNGFGGAPVASVFARFACQRTPVAQRMRSIRWIGPLTAHDLISHGSEPSALRLGAIFSGRLAAVGAGWRVAMGG
eukprot:3719241-Prymnesium_polylepis.1